MQIAGEEMERKGFSLQLTDINTEIYDGEESRTPPIFQNTI